MKPNASIVIPVRNRMGLLREPLESATFDALYSATPFVVATPRDPHGQHNLAVTLVDVSPSNFVVSVTALDGSAWGDPIEIDWIALGL